MRKLVLTNPTVPLVGLIVASLLFPIAAWMDFSALIQRELSGQAVLMDRLLNETRQLYSDTLNASAAPRSLAGSDAAFAAHRFGLLQETAGSTARGADASREARSITDFPVPVAFTIELARRLSAIAHTAEFGIVSDFPFATRPAAPLSPEQARILRQMRGEAAPQPIELSDAALRSGVTRYSPIIMKANCVSCHNTHEASTKRDWKVGDVRGLQLVSLRPEKVSVFARNRRMLADFCLLIFFGGWLFTAQRHQQRAIERFNVELNQSRDFLSHISGQLSKYMPPQIYRALLERRFDVAVSTERKKLSILFADIVDFTRMSESLQPEELTHVLNLYFDELSHIAEKHGGTVNKFIGDAILVFFGHPESHGEKADATACFAAAREMIAALPQLGERIRQSTPSIDLRLRVGINTGLCNVGNFGSSQRLDYTVIGAEVNVAARVIKAAEPNTIVITDKTFACLDATVGFVKLPPQQFKGVSREVGVYLVRNAVDEENGTGRFALKAEGLDLAIEPATADLHDLRAAQMRLQEIIRRKERDSG